MLCIFNEVIKNRLFCTDLVGVVVCFYTHTHTHKEDMIVNDAKRSEPAAEPLCRSGYKSV